MNYYVYLLKIVVERSMYAPHIQAPMAYLRELNRRGTLLLPGPFADQCGGMALIRAESEAEAQAIAVDSPVVAGVDTFDLRQWHSTGGDSGRITLKAA